MTSKRQADKPTLPPAIPEPGAPDGLGLVWITRALGGEDGAITDITALTSDDPDRSTFTLKFADGPDLLIRPSRWVSTIRLAELLAARGFPVPNYTAADMRKLGSAVSRFALGKTTQEVELMVDAFASVVAGLLQGAVRYDLDHAEYRTRGEAVQAAVAAVRYEGLGPFTPPVVIYDVHREVGMVWTVAVAKAIRDQLGTSSDAQITTYLLSAGLARGRLAARATMGSPRFADMPVWEVPNNWGGIDLGSLRDCRGNDAVRR